MKTNFSVVPKLMAKDPRLAAAIVRAFWAQKKSMLVDRTFRDGRTSELGLMYFRLTPLCNLRCVMCGQRGDKG
ncbi:MAG TPA: radical SAM protein, partial [Spirochaetales bacterium]|nr:radical SAM protein [Spirochaetales bacterium]